MESEWTQERMDKLRVELAKSPMRLAPRATVLSLLDVLEAAQSSVLAPGQEAVDAEALARLQIRALSR